MAVTLEASTPPRADRAVVFACDGSYAALRRCSRPSRSRALHPGGDFDICLCCADETPAGAAGLAQLGMRLLPGRRPAASSPALRLDAAADARWSTCGWRCRRPSPGEYRRLLYLDADVFVQGGDFAALMDVDLGAARARRRCATTSQWRTPGRRPEPVPAARAVGTAPYFNAGVLLIDVGRLQRPGDPRALRRLRAAAPRSDDPARPEPAERDAARRLGRVSPVWNWQYTWASRLFEAMEDAHVVHFIGPKKPWTHAGGELPLRFRRAYRAFFAEHFPERRSAPDGTRRMANPAFLREDAGQAPALARARPAAISTASRRSDGDPLSCARGRIGWTARSSFGGGLGGAGLAADALGAAARPARPLAARRRDRGHRPRPRLRRALERADAGRASLFGGRALAAGRGDLRAAGAGRGAALAAGGAAARRAGVRDRRHDLAGEGAVGPGYAALDARLARAVHLRFGLPAELPKLVKAQIKRADRISAWLEAVHLAGLRGGRGRPLLRGAEGRGPRARWRCSCGRRLEVKAAFLARHAELCAALPS